AVAALPAVVARRAGLLLDDHVRADQVDAALRIDAGDAHLDLVADVEHVLDLLHALVGELGDVEHAVLAGQQLDEGADGDDAHHLAGVLLADLHAVGDALDDLAGLGRSLGVGGGDEDAAVVLDVDLDARVGDDLVD